MKPGDNKDTEALREIPGVMEWWSEVS